MRQRWHPMAVPWPWAGLGWNGGTQSPIYLIGLATGKIERVLEGHPSAILTLSPSPV